MIIPRVVVEWVSADFYPSADGSVDAGDLAAFGRALGKGVCYGFTQTPQPAGCPCPSGLDPATDCPSWLFNANADDAPTVDAGDISAFATALGGPSCGGGPSKAANEKGQILTWFGIEYTGKKIPLGGTLIDEVAIVDEQKWAHALSDPYGYRASQAGRAAEKIPWSSAKVLYK